MNRLSFWSRALLCAGAVCALLLGGADRAAAQALYGASGSNGVGGTLYTLNPANGAVVSTIGPLNNVAGAPFGLTGMAFHPTTGVLYGSTANGSPTSPGFLVTVNPATGLVTPVGAFGAGVIGTCADITFASDGTLYGWEAAGGHHLVSINPLTGTAAPIGPGVGGLFGGGGLAARPTDNTLFSTPDGSTGPRTLRTVDRVTGISTVVGPLTGLPPGFETGSINAMDFSGGVLFGLLNNRLSPSLTNLVTINQATGAITNLGASVNNLDAIAFIPEPGSLSLLAGGAAVMLIRRRKSA